MLRRVFYASALSCVFGAALIYGGHLLYTALYVMLLLPAASLLTAVCTLWGISVEQAPAMTTVVKNERGGYSVTLRNAVRVGLGMVNYYFASDDFAVESDACALGIPIRPFMKPLTADVGFTIRYRGIYRLGLYSMGVTDFLGLFSLRRALSSRVEVIVYPRVRELTHFPLAAHLLSKAQANLNTRQEDYTDIADTRPYQPADPIKKIHWKLTAKRGEWIVKNYQIASQSGMAVLVDSTRHPLPYEESVKLEDRVVEYAVAVLRYCLRRQMPTELFFGRSEREYGRHIGDFEALYGMAARLEFRDPPQSFPCLAALNDYLNEAVDNVNVVILTASLNKALYERIINAAHFGHFVAVMYFVPERGPLYKESDDIYAMMSDDGIPCARFTGAED
jgi:uncharacterized protein (DUF58 family)